MDHSYYTGPNGQTPVAMETTELSGGQETYGQSPEVHYGYPQFPWVNLISGYNAPVTSKPAEVLCPLPQNGLFGSPEYLYLQPRPNMAYYLDVCPTNCCPRTVIEVPVNSQGSFCPPKISSFCRKRSGAHLETVPEEVELGEAENYMGTSEAASPMQDNNNIPMQDNNNIPMQDNNNIPMQDNNNIPMQDNNNSPMQEPSFGSTAEKSCQTDSIAGSVAHAPTRLPPKYTRTTVDLNELFDLKEKPQTITNEGKSPNQKGYCKFCRSNGEPYDVFSSHAFKNHLNETTCPILRKYVCPLCGQTGSKAHTQKYCPETQANEVPQTRLYRKVRNSVGNFRILKY